MLWAATLQGGIGRQPYRQPVKGVVARPLEKRTQLRPEPKPLLQPLRERDTDVSGERESKPLGQIRITRPNQAGLDQMKQNPHLFIPRKSEANWPLNLPQNHFHQDFLEEIWMSKIVEVKETVTMACYKAREGIAQTESREVAVFSIKGY